MTDMLRCSRLCTVALLTVVCGCTSGLRNFMQQFPDQRFMVIVLGNRAEPYAKAIAKQVGDLSR